MDAPVFATRHSLFAGTEAEQRARVVAEARSWIGTPYRHEGAVKKAGCDCAMLLVRVFVDTGLVPAFDPRPYSKTWFLHRDEEKYLSYVLPWAREIPESEVGAGDVILWKIGRLFAHGGIVSAWPRVVHAFAPARMVIETDISMKGVYEKAARRCFSYWMKKEASSE